MLVSSRGELSARVTLYTARSFVDIGIFKKTCISNCFLSSLVVGMT